MIATTRKSDTELAVFVLPDSLMKHHANRNKKEVLAQAIAECKNLSALEGDAFVDQAPKLLMLLAILDRMNDARTVGMIPDYMNF
jgi:hypothetical protein